MKNFLDFYKPPFKNTLGTVFSSNNNWAFTFGDDFRDNDKIQTAIMNSISGESKVFSKEVLYHKGAEIFVRRLAGEQMLMEIRGWGALISNGSLKLNNEEAAKVQDDFCDYLIEKMTT